MSDVPCRMSYVVVKQPTDKFPLLRLARRRRLSTATAPAASATAGRRRSTRGSGRSASRGLSATAATTATSAARAALSGKSERDQLRRLAIRGADSHQDELPSFMYVRHRQTRLHAGQGELRENLTGLLVVRIEYRIRCVGRREQRLGDDDADVSWAAGCRIGHTEKH